MSAAFEFADIDTGAGGFGHISSYSLSLGQYEFTRARDPQDVCLIVEYDICLDAIFDQVLGIIGQPV